MCDLNWVACWFSVTNNWATCWSENYREHENIHVKSTRHGDVNVMKQQAASFWVCLRLRPHSDSPRFCHCLPLVSVEHPAGFRSQTIATYEMACGSFLQRKPSKSPIIPLEPNTEGWKGWVKNGKNMYIKKKDLHSFMTAGGSAALWRCQQGTSQSPSNDWRWQWSMASAGTYQAIAVDGGGGLWIGFRIERLPISHWYWMLLDTSGTFKIPMDGIPVTAAGGMATQLHHSPARGAENNPSYDIIWGLLVRSAVYDEPQTHHPLVTTHVMSCPR